MWAGYRQAGPSDVTLRWMAERAGQCGLALDAGRLEESTAASDGGRLHESRRGVFRLLPERVRRLPTEAAVAASAVRRWGEEGLGYRPGNLGNYVERRRCAGVGEFRRAGEEEGEAAAGS